jgi:hypothetical protein
MRQPRNESPSVRLGLVATTALAIVASGCAQRARDARSSSELGGTSAWPFPDMRPIDPLVVGEAADPPQGELLRDLQGNEELDVSVLVAAADRGALDGAFVMWHHAESRLSFDGDHDSVVRFGSMPELIAAVRAVPANRRVYAATQAAASDMRHGLRALTREEIDEIVLRVGGQPARAGDGAGANRE